MNESKLEEEKSGEPWQHEINSHKERYKFLVNNELMSDVQFVVNTDGNDEKKRFYAHKIFLSVHSPVFEAMFYGSSADDSKEIEIVDITPKAFEIMLTFIYTGEISEVSDLQSVFKNIYAAKKYQMVLLMKACCEFLTKKMTNASVLEILVQAKNYNLEDLANKCMDYLKYKINVSIQSKEFLNIDMQSLCTILQSDNLMINEYELYLRVLDWSKAECVRQNLSDDIKNLRKVLGDAMKLIRFPLMNPKEIASISSEPEYCLPTDEEIVKIHEQIQLGDLCKRVTFNNNLRDKYYYY